MISIFYGKRRNDSTIAGKRHKKRAPAASVIDIKSNPSPILLLMDNVRNVAKVIVK